MKTIENYIPEPNTGCWLYDGYLNAYGYGEVHVSPGKKEKVHRMAYEDEFGSVPEGLHVLHRCNVRCCVNPKHLYAGTPKQNMQDAISCGSHISLHPSLASNPGEKNGRAKLTADQVPEIKKLYAAGGIRQVDLASQFGIGQAAISKIIRGENWC